MGPGIPGWNPAIGPGPMTVGRLLDRVWTILRGNFRLVVRLGVMPTAVMMALYGVMGGAMAAAGLLHFPPPSQPPDPRVFWVLFPAMLIVTVPMMVVFAVYQAATCEAALAANHGATATSSEFYRKAWKKAGRYTWLVVLCGLIMVAPFMLGVALFGLAGALLGTSGGNANPGAFFLLIPLVFLGYIGAFVYMIWMTLRLGLAFPACVAEDLTAWKAVRRAGRLAVKAKGRMFVVLLAVCAISYVAMMIFEVVAIALIGILMLIGSALSMRIDQPLSIAVLVVVGIAFLAAICLFSMLTWAAYAISLTAIYEDQVLRIDGPPANTVPTPPMSGEPA